MIEIAIVATAYSLSLATTVLTSLLIVVRILRVGRIPGTTNQSRTSMEIIVESAALFTVASLVYIPILAVQLTKGSETAYPYVQVFWAYTAVSHSFHS
jgi:hypothetical protein